jgi:MscS family membrane protein
MAFTLLTNTTLYLEQVFPNPWARAGILVGIAIVIAWLFTIIINFLANHVAKKTKTKVDDLIIERGKKPVFLLLLFLGIKAAILTLGLNGAIDKIIDSINALLFMYLLGAVGNIIIDAWGSVLAKRTKTKVDETILPLFHKTLGVVFVVVAIMWVLNIWGIDITPYLAGLGIGGLVLGLALQDSLKNILGGVSMIMDRNFNIGDKVKLESGELGEVISIGLRSTKIRTYDFETIIVPNGQLANMRLQNYVQPNPRVRVVVRFGVEYGSDVDKVKKVVNDTLKKIKDVSDQPYMNTIFTEMADFALLFEARFFVDDYKEAYNKKLEATQAIYGALRKAKINIPFPTRTVYMKKG